MSGDANASSSSPATSRPALTAEEKAARDERLQREHENYIKSIATMRSLPRLRSTIAGAGGKTNEQSRVAEERERERLARMTRAAQEAAAREESRKTHVDKVSAFEQAQAKKRAKRQRKKQQKKRAPGSDSRAEKRARHEADDGEGERSGSTASHSSHSSASSESASSEDD